MTLRLGLILVILSGLAGALSAGSLLLGIYLSDLGSALADLWPLLTTLVVAIVGMSGTVSRRTWGPLLVAASSGVWVVFAALNIAAWVAAVFAASAIIGILVAAVLWRTSSSEDRHAPA